jgi:hypothetical protein
MKWTSTDIFIKVVFKKHYANHFHCKKESINARGKYFTARTILHMIIKPHISSRVTQIRESIEKNVKNIHALPTYSMDGLSM